jgi:hypothetical protein
VSSWEKACNCKNDYTVAEESPHQTTFYMTKPIYYSNMAEKSSFFVYKEAVDIDKSLWLTNFLIFFGNFLLKWLKKGKDTKMSRGF